MDITPLSLASARVSERQFCRRILVLRLRVLLAFVVFDLLSMAAGFFGLGSVNGRHQQLSRMLKRTRAESTRTNQQLSNLRNSQDLIHWRRRMSAKGLTLVDSFGSLVSALPQSAWLSRVSAGTQNGVVQVDGGAPDLSAVAHIAMVLGSERAFREVRLGPSDSLQMDDIQAVKFTLFLTLTGYKSADSPESTAEASSKGGSS